MKAISLEQRAVDVGFKDNCQLVPQPGRCMLVSMSGNVKVLLLVIGLYLSPLLRILGSRFGLLDSQIFLRHLQKLDYIMSNCLAIRKWRV